MTLAVAELASLSKLLDQALELCAEQQDAWLAALAPEHQPLRPVLQKLLAEQDDSETQGLLNQLPQWTRHAAEQRLALGNAMHTGCTVGPYRLIRLLGRGGMGAVWLAERVDGAVKRSVALKLPFTGDSQRQLAERFARERDILAALEHRHIARLYDAGVAPDGQPYLALEHVAGVPISQHCDSCRLDLRARVKLFLQVLHAVQYAHSRLVIHRDLKPSNIFVTAEGQVQLLDFGIATLLDAGGAPGAMLTEFGAAALTPDYASPEQVAGQTIGTASDVYSLGVVFYELISGQRPYRLARQSRAALEEAILGTDPAQPSRMADAEAAAASRSVSLPVLRRQLQGDLDNIALKALKKNPAERYPSAESFDQDLQRWLDGEAVQAHPDSLAYRARKFLQRHRLPVGAAALVALAVLAGLAISLQQAHVAREQSLLAQREAHKAKAVQDFLVGLFNEADPARAQGRELAVRDLMARAERDLHAKLDSEPELVETLSGVLVDIFGKLGDETKALPLAEARRDLALRRHGAHSVEYGDALLSLAAVQGSMVRRDLALQTLAQAQAVLEEHAGERQRELLKIPGQVVDNLLQIGRASEARELLLQALPKVQAALGPTDWEVVELKSKLATTYAQLGQPLRAAAIYGELEPLLDHPPPAAAIAAAELRYGIGYAQSLAGQWPQAARSLQTAAAELDRLAGPRNSGSIGMQKTLASVYAESGDYARAAATFDAVARRSAEFYGHDDDTALLDRSDGIAALVWMNRLAQAEAIGRETVRTAEQNKTILLVGRRALKRHFAIALVAVGKAAEALDLMRGLAAEERIEPSSGHARTLLTTAGALAALRRSDEAANVAHEAAQLWAHDDGLTSRVMLGKARLTEALARARAGASSTAMALADDAESIFGKTLPADHPNFELVQIARAAALAAAGRAQEAERMADAARERFHARSGGTLPKDPVVFF